MSSSAHALQIADGDRFEFGENWSRFLTLIDDKRVIEAEQSLKQMLNTESLHDKSFIDVGSGSGLFSLAAKRLGARVHSLDYDPQSVACTGQLKSHFFDGDDTWTIEEGSVLNLDYLLNLGTFDVVYSWGVLHHTGALWQALENVCALVKPGGKLFIAIYNDTGSQSSRWKWIKRTYNKLPSPLRIPFTVAVIAPAEIKSVMSGVVRLRPTEYVENWLGYGARRGMSRWRDIIDWVGGYPYEVATPDEIFEFFQRRNFTLTKMNTGRVGLGCNQFVFVSKQGK